MKQTYDPEKFQLSIARLKRGGKNFEVVIEPDKVVDYKEGKAIDIDEMLQSDDIYVDAQKGLLSSSAEKESVFGKLDDKSIIKTILDKGDVHLTQKFKQNLREKKRKQIISIITQNCIDPRTKAPHTPTRIESALHEAKVNIDDFTPAMQQAKEILKKIQSVLPIRFEQKELHILIPAHFATHSYGILKTLGDVQKHDWISNGDLCAVLVIPGGLEHEIIDKLNALTQGTVEVKAWEK